MRNHNLTQREREVLQLAAEGLTQRQIGDSLGLKWRTVNSHLAKVHAKLGVKCRVQAVNRAVQLGAIVRTEGIPAATAETLLADVAYLRKHLERIERILRGVHDGQR